MRIVFFGTPSFAAEVLEDLIKHHFEIVAIVSKPDRPKGRSKEPVPTPVKITAQKIAPEIPFFQPEMVSDLDFAPTLEAFQADLFVVVAYGEIIKQHLLSMPKLACINLHASLLPKYRGAAPIQRAIINGEVESGVTIMHMVKKMDAGDMIRQAVVSILPEMTFGELNLLLCEIGKTTLRQVLKEYETGIPPATIQDLSQVTFAAKIELEDCEIDWTQPAQKLHDLIRGVNPFPGAWCFVHVKGEKKRLKVHRTRVVDVKNSIPGTLDHSFSHQLVLSTGSQCLELLEVQLEGKKAMQTSDLLRGIPLNQWQF